MVGRFWLLDFYSFWVMGADGHLGMGGWVLAIAMSKSCTIPGRSGWRSEESDLICARCSIQLTIYGNIRHMHGKIRV